MYYYIGAAFLFLLLAWTLGSLVIIRTIEEPTYSVLSVNDGYEVRQYNSYIVAETTVSGTYAEATSAGFRIIADYIFGNNVSKQSIAMTAPVLESKPSEKIAMTVPVLDTENTAGERTISFVLPSEYTLETVPIPNTTEVRIRAVAAQKVAALQFTWYPTAARIEKKKETLRNFLERDGVPIVGNTQVARYNPPLSMPLILRNEILIPIE